MMSAFERGMEPGRNRNKLVAEVMKWAANTIEHPGEAVDVTPLDEAAKNLAAKLNEPRTCSCCGQVIRTEDEHDGVC